MVYLIIIVFIAIFAGIMMIWTKKENENLDNLLSNLTEEQKNDLKDNQVENFDEKSHTWTQRAMIAEVKVKGENKVNLTLLWYNTVIQNNTLNQCQSADINMKKSDFDAKGLKEGDFVKMFMDPEKCNAKIL